MKALLGSFLNLICLSLLLCGVYDIWRYSKRDEVTTVDVSELSKVEDGTWVKVRGCKLSLERAGMETLSVLGAKPKGSLTSLIPLIRPSDPLGSPSIAIFCSDSAEIKRLIKGQEVDPQGRFLDPQAFSDALERIAKGCEGLDEVEGYLTIEETHLGDRNRKLKKLYPELGPKVVLIEEGKSRSMTTGVVFVVIFLIIVGIRSILWRRVEGRKSVLQEGLPKPPPLPVRGVPPPLPHTRGE